MRRRAAFALLTVPVLVVGACAGGPSAAEDEACNQVHAWLTGGAEAERFTEFVTAAQERLADYDDAAVAAAVDQLAGASEADRVARAEQVVDLCRGLGWEPPEG